MALAGFTCSHPQWALSATNVEKCNAGHTPVVRCIFRHYARSTACGVRSKGGQGGGRRERRGHFRSWPTPYGSRESQLPVTKSLMTEAPILVSKSVPAGQASCAMTAEPCDLASLVRWKTSRDVGILGHGMEHAEAEGGGDEEHNARRV